MSLVHEIRDQFRIYICSEEDSVLGQFCETFFQTDYQIKKIPSFHHLDFEIKSQRPHVLLMFYKPLSVTFRTMLQKVKEQSPETEVILLGGMEYWPGIKSTLDQSLAHGFWPWPGTEKEILHLNLDQILEKLAYKFMVEQSRGDGQKLIEKIENIQSKLDQPNKPIPKIAVRALPPVLESESQLVEHLVGHFKGSFPVSEFAYLKNYEPREEVLVYKTSFSLENFSRGQAVSYPKNIAKKDRDLGFPKLKEKVTELFISNDFVIYPVQSPNQVYGFFVGFQLSHDAQAELESGVNFMGLLLRNLFLEKEFASPKSHPLLQREVDASQIQNLASREISRSRRTQSPLSCIYVHARKEEDLDSQGLNFLGLADNHLRVYDLTSKLNHHECVILLPHCDSTSASIKAERLRRLFFRKMQDENIEGFRIGLGVSSFPELCTGPAELIETAKQACYQVLGAGMNKVCLYTQEEEFQPEYQLR